MVYGYEQVPYLIQGRFLEVPAAGRITQHHRLTIYRLVSPFAGFSCDCSM